MAGCPQKNPRGELRPPAGAADWEPKFSPVFNDDYTREAVNLSGRAPNDVLDQKLFSARLGYADVVALVEVEQVWSRGRYEGRQNQYMDLKILEVLLGSLPKDTALDQLVEVESEDELPGTLQERPMLFFVRWAPGQEPSYHHHLMFADQETVAYVRAMVRHATDEGELAGDGSKRKRKRRKRKRRGKSKRKQADIELAPGINAGGQVGGEAGAEAGTDAEAGGDAGQSAPPAGDPAPAPAEPEPSGQPAAQDPAPTEAPPKEGTTPAGDGPAPEFP